MLIFKPLFEYYFAHVGVCEHWIWLGGTGDVGL